MRGISEERLKKKLSYFDGYDFTISGGIEENCIRELIDECQELNPWQPIDTAPKDKWVWLYFPIFNTQTEGQYLSETCEWETDLICDIGQPTHWMELPEPPK